MPGHPELALAAAPAAPARGAAEAGAGMGALAHAGWPAPWRILYGLYAWLQFVLIALVTLSLLLLLPGSLERRRRLAAAGARLTLRLAGMRVCVGAGATSGTRSAAPVSGLPAPCVIVANHCSYLDGVLLAGMLPPHFSFVIKREMSAVPLAGMLLRRIGVEFMERRAQGSVLRDTRRVLRHAAGGQALVFFPEGTFSPRIGLLPFHIGAFATATRARLPLVPLVIRGTRHCLPPGSPWPRPGRIEVQILPAIAPSAEGSGAAAILRERARAALLAALGEPDLANLANPAASAATPQAPPSE